MRHAVGILKIAHGIHACILSCFSCVWLFVTPWTVAHQAPLSMGFSRQEYWVGCHVLLKGDLSEPGISCFLHWQVSSLPLALPGKLTYGIHLSYSKTISMSLILGRVESTVSPLLRPPDSESASSSKCFICTLKLEKTWKKLLNKNQGNWLGAYLTAKDPENQKWKGASERGENTERSSRDSREIYESLSANPPLPLKEQWLKHQSSLCQKKNVKNKSKSWKWALRRQQIFSMECQTGGPSGVFWFYRGVNLQLSLTRLFYHALGTQRKLWKLIMQIILLCNNENKFLSKRKYKSLQSKLSFEPVLTSYSFSH